ncbi:AraC family transcriptional regulator [Cuneatibacter sp. NSJ-177]|jgi:AraC-like DNA-binding protein/mannose-6-phosphate isomerase-like protein (cupin superfamily)|uniref:AraC family transcriptional regulator n=1 Tax=Cuneatibacter sp. NSJ-177 TaxID=2931401 RepID=UPI001FD4782B|nr:AraC family transcriptional regulator [Cuneatibacter sp. NSJ-177]MCJ7835296.1 AraC family transcriptional regulator [Cuneatibacter sp. NSJ-177]
MDYRRETQERIQTVSKDFLPIVTRITCSQENHTWKANVHMHDNEVELHLVKQGSTTVTIHNQSFTVTAGDILAISPGFLHMVESDAPVYLYTCRFRQSPFAPGNEDVVIRPDVSPVMSSGKYYTFILKLMEAMVEIAQHGIAQNADICNMLGGALWNIFRQIFSTSQIAFSLPKKSLSQDILHYINSHYDQDVTLASLSQAFFVSSSHISSEFKKEFHISPINYLINRRICEAKWYLINTQQPVHEIAQRVGYGNCYHFSKLFTKRSGVSPEKFREMHRIV